MLKSKKKGNAYILQGTSEPSMKRRKMFADLGARMQKERTESLLHHVKDYVANDCPELSVTQLLGYLIHRVNIQSDKRTAQVGHHLYRSTINDTHSFDVNDAVALMHSLTLSREQMRKMRHILAYKGIYFPTSNELLEGRKKLRPVVSPVLDGKGVQVQYNDLVKMTIESVLTLVSKEKLNEKASVLEMIFKDGGDGDGQQVVWNSKSMLDAKEYMFQYGITPLKLIRRRDDGSTVCLWQNHTPNASQTLRPLFLIREKGNGEDLLSAVITATDKARVDLST